VNNEEKNEVLTALEAAEYLKIGVPTLYRYLRAGKLPCFKIGNRWRCKKSLLDDWMEEQSTKKGGLFDENNL